MMKNWKHTTNNEKSTNSKRNRITETCCFHLLVEISQDANEKEKVHVIETNDPEWHERDELISSSANQLDLSVDKYKKEAMIIDEEITNNYIADDSDDDCIITGINILTIQKLLFLIRIEFEFL